MERWGPEMGNMNRLNVSEVGTAATVERKGSGGSGGAASMSLKWGLLRLRRSRWLVKGSFQLGSASAHLPGAVFFVFSYQQMRPEA
jgi:hypothetical protein